MENLAIRIEKIKRETRSAFTLVLEKHPIVAGYQSGQFINLFCEIQGEEVSRPYSFSSSPSAGGPPAVTVKRIPGGLMSNYLVENLKEGDSVSVSPPGGRFTTSYKKERKRHLLMIAGGSGITPVFSILKSVLYHEPGSAVTLYYSNRDMESIIFKDSLHALEKYYKERFEVFHFLEKLEEANFTDEKIIPGRISKTKLKEFLEKKVETEQLEVFICGPDGLMDFAVTSLMQLGVEKNKIHTEYYLCANEKPQDSSSWGKQELALVRIRNFYGQSLSFKAPKNQPVLSSALDQGYKLRHSCREAMCGSCRVRLISGQIEMKENYALTNEAQHEGYVLLCSGFPLSDEVMLAYD